jgi:hypothetical protein
MFRRTTKSNFSNSQISYKKYSPKGKSYANPFFDTRKKQAKNTAFRLAVPNKAKIITLAVFGLLLVSLWFILYSNYFTISEIEARGDNRLDPENIKESAWSQIADSNFILWPQKNIFIFNKAELIDNLNLRYSFNDIIIHKKLTNKIIINYNEKEHSLMWLEKSIYYYLDRQGYIVDRIGDAPDDKNYPLIENASSYFIDSNRISLNPDFISSAFMLIDLIKNLSDMPIDRFIIDDNNSTLKLVISSGPQLIFNTSGDLEKQLNTILTLKNEILKDDFFKKEYIDVRTGDRIFQK